MMGVVGGALGYHLLRRFARYGESKYCANGVPAVYQGRSKLEVLFGPQLWGLLAGKSVIDCGCGRGDEVIELAEHGARKVIGIDLREHVLREARHKAAAAGLADRCTFVTGTDEKADVILSVDA